MRLLLAEMRESSSFSQIEIARIAGISPKTEWNWENGKSFPNVKQLCVLCDLFDTDPNTMVGWYDEHPEDMPVSAPPGLTADENRVVESYRALTPERRRVIAEQVEDAAARSREQETDGSSYEEVVA